MVAMIGGVDNGSFFVPFGVLTFWRPFARFLFYRKQYLLLVDEDFIHYTYINDNGEVMESQVS